MTQPLYLQIAQHLREHIINGDYPLNTRIPTEKELAAALDVSRPTVRQALTLLEQEGRLIRVKGSGTFVTEPKILHESTHFIIGYKEESREHNYRLRTRVLELQKKSQTKLLLRLLVWQKASV